MNAERLLQLYDRVSEAPDAIPRLRRFILDLAVRGKLVDQDPDDEPAEELEERISEEISRLSKSGQARKPRQFPPLEPEEVPFELPLGWAWSQISRIGLLSPRNDAEDDLVASFVPMPSISADYGVSNHHEPRLWSEIKKGYTHFAEGDVGLAKITPCFENGKSTVFRNLTGGIGSGTTELHIVRPLFVSPDYIVAFLKSPFFIGNGIPRMTGTAGQKRVPLEYFAASPFPLPPLEEQHRIVAKVDELMALCDSLEAERKKREATRDRLTTASLSCLTAPDLDEKQFKAHADFAINVLPELTTRPDQIKILRQTILDLAVRGKLVEQDPNDEPASELLKNAVLETLQLSGSVKRRNEVPPSLVNPKDAPFELPPGWTWARFPELGKFGRGKSKHRPRNDPVLFEGGVHYMIQTGDVARSRGSISTYSNKYNDRGLAQSHKWPKGTMCITIAANIADSGILEFEACFPDSVVGFVSASMFDDVRYFEYFIRTAKATLLEFAPATAQKNINLETLAAVLIPLPPLNEQRRIVARIDELMTVCDQLEQRLGSGLITRCRLLQTLLVNALEPAVTEAA